MSLQAARYQQYDEKVAITPPAFYNTTGQWFAPSIPHTAGLLVPQEGYRQRVIGNVRAPLLQSYSNVPAAALNRQRDLVAASQSGNQSWQYQRLSAPLLPTGGQGVAPMRIGAYRAGGR